MKVILFFILIFNGRSATTVLEFDSHSTCAEYAEGLKRDLQKEFRGNNNVFYSCREKYAPG